MDMEDRRQPREESEAAMDAKVMDMERPPPRAALYRQLLPVLVVNLGALSSGLALGYSAVLLPQIRPTTAHSNNLTSSLQTGQDEDFSVTTEQGSWIASIFGLGAIVGGLLSAALGPRYGRRISLLLLALPDLAAWLMLASPPSLPSLLIARHLHPPQNRLCHPVCRFLTGLAAAGYSPNIQIFVAETCQAHHRGWMAGLTVPIMSLGILTVYLLGSWLPWRLVAAAVCPVPVFLGVSLLLLWDSPQFYLTSTRPDKAAAALAFYRGNHWPDADKEMKQMKDSLSKNISSVGLVAGLKLILTDTRYLRPFLILNTLFLFMLFSGKFAIEFYAVDIFKAVGGGDVDAYLSAVIIAVIQLGGSLVFLPLVKHLSRKVLLVTTSLTMGAALVLLGLTDYSHLHPASLPNLQAQLSWLPLACVSLYLLAAPIGLCSVPFMLMPEFFPAEVRSLLGGITVSISNLSLFIVVKTFTNLSSSLGGEFATFWVYSGVCFAAVPFIMVFVPETKDTELTSVSEKFVKSRSLDTQLSVIF